MKKIIKLTESELKNIVKKIIIEIGGYDDPFVMASHAKHVLSNASEMGSELTLLLVKCVTMLLDTDLEDSDKKGFFRSIIVNLGNLSESLDGMLGDFTEDKLRNISKKLSKKLKTLKSKFIIIDQMNDVDFQSIGGNFNHLVEDLSDALEITSEFSKVQKDTVDTFSDRFNRDEDPNFGFR